MMVDITLRVIGGLVIQVNIAIVLVLVFTIYRVQGFAFGTADTLKREHLHIGWGPLPRLSSRGA